MTTSTKRQLQYVLPRSILAAILLVFGIIALIYKQPNSGLIIILCFLIFGLDLSQLIQGYKKDNGWRWKNAKSVAIRAITPVMVEFQVILEKAVAPELVELYMQKMYRSLALVTGAPVHELSPVEAILRGNLNEAEFLVNKINKGISSEMYSEHFITNKPLFDSLPDQFRHLCQTFLEKEGEPFHG